MTKTKANPILEEVWAARDAYAKRFNYDLKAILEDQKKLAEKLRQEGCKVESLSDKKQLPEIRRQGH